MTRRIGIGVVGAGRMGSIHARLIARNVPEARLAGIADLNIDAARQLAGELGEPPVFGSLDEMLTAPGVNAVLIATSSSRHDDAGGLVIEQDQFLRVADTPQSVVAVQRANREYLRRFGI